MKMATCLRMTEKGLSTHTETHTHSVLSGADSVQEFSEKQNEGLHADN